jgi:hypothetical protein
MPAFLFTPLVRAEKSTPLVAGNSFLFMRGKAPNIDDRERWSEIIDQL